MNIDRGRETKKSISSTLSHLEEWQAHTSILLFNIDTSSVPSVADASIYLCINI